MSLYKFRIALHGGSGARKEYDYGHVIEHMRGVIEAGRDQLRKGASAVDIAIQIVAVLESSGLYIAGRGSSSNCAGQYELDACVMDGASGRAGAVAALEGFESPIEVARRIMDVTPYVMFAGQGAAAFARQQDLLPIQDAKNWFTNACGFEMNQPPGIPSHGTVGCVVLDGAGRLAAATSTGGLFGKPPGRVGDSAVIGASTWADTQVAVSCTGQGEIFMRTAAAAEIAHRMRFGHQSLHAAAEDTLKRIVELGGTGGLVAVDSCGNIAMPFISSGMKRAALLPDGSIIAEAP